jgi:hypothetical protein
MEWSGSKILGSIAYLIKQLDWTHIPDYITLTDWIKSAIYQSRLRLRLSDQSKVIELSSLSSREDDLCDVDI